MVFALITAWLAYKRAQANGRNAILWAFAGAAVFIATQLLVSLGCGVFFGFGIALFGWSENIYDKAAVPVTIVAIAASFAASWLLLRYLDRNTSAENPDDAPPPPPSFN